MRLRTRRDYRIRRHRRVRRRIAGSAQRLRMSIMCSLKHIYVQFIDDDRGVTVAAASTLGGGQPKNVATARELGRRAAEAAKRRGVTRVVVDRGGHRYHGRVKALIEAATESGLVIRSAAGHRAGGAEAAAERPQSGGRGGKEES